MPKTVVVLEDEPTLVQLLEDLLSLEGFQTRKPAPTVNLLQDFRTDPPDAVLMDVNLRDANGLDLLGKIRADEELKDLFVVLCSGQDVREEAMRRGADNFLMKPYMPDDLVNILKAKLNP